MASKMATTTNLDNIEEKFRHPDFLQSLNGDLRGSKILKLFVNMKDNEKNRHTPISF